MGFFTIKEDGDFTIDYDRHKKKYRVSYFEDNHYKDECCFDVFNDGVSCQNIAKPVKRFDDYNECVSLSWWAGYCPKCGIMLNFNYADPNGANRKQYCWHCGQLVEFK